MSKTGDGSAAQDTIEQLFGIRGCILLIFFGFKGDNGVGATVPTVPAGCL